MAGVVLYRTAERPGIKAWILDEDGALIDFSSGYTFELKIGRVGSAAAFTKTSGLTGAAGSGTETSGVPNLTASFTAGELDSLTKGRTTGQIKATTGGLDRVFQFPVEIRDVIT